MPAKHRVRKRIHVCVLLLCMAFFAFGRGPIALASAHAPAASFDYLSRPVAVSSVNRVDVTTTADSQPDGDTTSFTNLSNTPGLDGKISLREAIIAANSTPISETLTIGFAIPISDTNYYSNTWTITLNSQLPDLTRGRVTIDGTTQLAGALHPPIVLDGNGGMVYDGMVIRSSGNVVRRLTLRGFFGNAIVLRGAMVSSNTIAGCYIGTDSTGKQARPNGTGILISDGAFGNTIGGDTSAARNVIAGSDWEGGVLIQGASTYDNMVVGNWIGVDSSGAVLLPNEGGGVIIRDGAHRNQIGKLGSGNVIADRYYSVLIRDGMYNVLAGNTIGLAADGQTRLRDAGGALFRPMVGVYLDRDAHYNEIGRPDQGNIISGNGTGVNIVGGTSNRLAGNIIGLGADGLTLFGNLDGIYIREGASYNIVGGDALGARNVISGNSADGIRILGPGTDHNEIKSNYIGVDRDGIRAGFGNGGYGVRIDYGAEKNSIGEASTTPSNVIAYNGAGGIRLDAPFNSVAGNLIGMGADLTPLGNQNNGVRIGAGGDGTKIGPGNKIAYNQFSGLIISAQNITVTDNLVQANIRSGICVTGEKTHITANRIIQNGFGSGPWIECPIRGGIVITGTDNTIINENKVYDNIGFGITVHGGQGNQILRNSISGNSEGGIRLEEGGNGEIFPPVIQSVTLIEIDTTIESGTTIEIKGTSCSSCLVELFADDANERLQVVGSTHAKDDRSFSLQVEPGTPATYITATHTDPDGNTSPFAEAVDVPPPPPPPPDPSEIVSESYLPFILRLR